MVELRYIRASILFTVYCVHVMVVEQTVVDVFLLSNSLVLATRLSTYVEWQHMYYC